MDSLTCHSLVNNKTYIYKNILIQHTTNYSLAVHSMRVFYLEMVQDWKGTLMVVDVLAVMTQAL